MNKIIYGFAILFVVGCHPDYSRETKAVSPVVEIADAPEWKGTFVQFWNEYNDLADAKDFAGVAKLKEQVQGHLVHWRGAVEESRPDTKSFYILQPDEKHRWKAFSTVVSLGNWKREYPKIGTVVSFSGIVTSIGPSMTVIDCEPKTGEAK